MCCLTIRELLPPTMNSTTVHSTTSGISIELKWTLTKIHATTFVLAWFFLIPLSAAIARYFRRFAAHRPNGLFPFHKTFWFQTHRAINILALCLMLMGLLTILIAHNWNWLGPKVGGTHNTSSVAWHTICGVLAVALAIAQPFNALFRCTPSHSYRWLFNTIHRCSAICGWFLAASCIFIASIYFGKRFTNSNAAIGLTTTIVLFVVLSALTLDTVHLFGRPNRTGDVENNKQYNTRFAQSIHLVGSSVQEKKSQVVQ
ncbi:Ferric-chelate reductase 1 [Aphelenchoides besseyi]|nr:Ferric-chelate reductase 1 [Aphelenchoides besseyi]